MKNRVKNYLDYFRKTSYPDLFDEVSLTKLAYTEAKYGNVQTEETIMEICLTREEKTCDYSIRIDTDDELTKEYWLELDSEKCLEEGVEPCYFADASKVQPGNDNELFYNQVLLKLAGEKRTGKLIKKLRECVALLENKCTGLYQIGVMTARQEDESIRIFTDYMSGTDVIEYLREIGWNGNLGLVDSWISKLECYSDRKKFIIDFDIFESGISDKIGINFGTPNHFLQPV